MTVLPPAATLDDDSGDDWGEWDFVSLPRAGDHIDIERNEQAEVLTVRHVIHFIGLHTRCRGQRRRIFSARNPPFASSPPDWRSRSGKGPVRVFRSSLGRKRQRDWKPERAERG